MADIGYNTRGKHVIVDAWGVNAAALDNPYTLLSMVRRAVSVSGATLLDVTQKMFHPQGVTLLALLSESHFSIHTYPEAGFAAIDCYVCGSADAEKAVDYVLEALEPTHVERRVIVRGVMSGVNNEMEAIV
jgi:S-adenosylmethionine decarboxylase